MPRATRRDAQVLPPSCCLKVDLAYGESVATRIAAALFVKSEPFGASFGTEISLLMIR